MFEYKDEIVRYLVADPFNRTVTQNVLFLTLKTNKLSKMSWTSEKLLLISTLFPQFALERKKSIWCVKYFLNGFDADPKLYQRGPGLDQK